MATTPAKAPDGTTSGAMELDGEAALNSRAASNEGIEQKTAFEEYWKMGQARSLSKIAEKVGRHLTTIEKWSAAGRWVARIKERESYQAEHQKSAAAAMKDSETDSRIRNLVGVAIAKWFKEFSEGTIKFRGVEDLDKLISIQARLSNANPRSGAPKPSSVHQHLHVHQGGGSPMATDLNLRGKTQGDLLATIAGIAEGIKRITGRPPLDPNELPPTRSTRPALEEKKPAGVDPGIIDVDLSIDE